MLVALLASGSAACGERDEASGIDASEAARAVESLLASPDADPLAATPEPTKTPKPKSSWARIAAFHARNDSRYNSEDRTPLLAAESRRVRLSWKVTPLAAEYNWAVIVFGKGQTPESSTGIGPMLFSESGEPDVGNVTFTVKPLRPFYVWTELWHCEIDVTVSEGKK
jgi:hypothetical protein